jgi:hypothetical protein
VLLVILLGATSSPNDTVTWLVLLGLGLSPVMVGATDVIVGNALVELAGVAGGLQSTALQVGGTIGTAVLGAVMAAEFPAPTEGHTKVVARLKPATPTAKMISPRTEPQTRMASTPTTARITRFQTVPATPPSCTAAEVNSRHHCPCWRI